MLEITVVLAWQWQLKLPESVLNARHWAKPLDMIFPIKLSWRPVETGAIIIPV